MRRGLRLALAAALAAAGTTTARAADAPAMLTRYLCGGGEPAWTLALDTRGGALTRPGASGDAPQELVGRLQRFSALEPEWLLWRGHTRAGAHALMATLRAEPCAAAPGDAAAPYRVLASFPDGSAASGCCTIETRLDLRAAPLARAAGKPDADWSRALPELLPALRACLRAASADRVTFAALAPDAWVAVRVAAADGTRSDCRVDLAAAEAPQVSGLAPGAAPPPGDGAPVLYVARGEPPALRCGRAERVLDGRGIAVGYLHYADGCAPPASSPASAAAPPPVAPHAP